MSVTSRIDGARARRRAQEFAAKREAERLYYEEGLTLAEVGERFGVSRERVRQWLVALGHEKPRRGGSPAQKRRRQAEHRARVEACREEVERRFREGDPAEEIAADLGLPRPLVREALDRVTELERKMILGANKRQAFLRTPNEQLLANLRAAAEDLGPYLKCQEFAAWARERGLTGPQTYMGRFGSWREARRLAGLPPVRGPAAPRSDRISLAECADAVRSVWDELGRAPSVDEYERLRGSRPSIATVRLRTGGWTDALLLADGLREEVW